MPSPSAAQRNTAPAPPAKRNAFYCRRCKPNGAPIGHAQNAHAAYLAGIRHFLETHDMKEDYR
jgi:hypothetical protein